MNQGSLAHAEDVDRGQHCDGEKSCQLRARDRPGPSSQRDGKENVARREEREKGPEVLAESRCERGDSAGHDHEKRRPPEQKAGQRPIGLFQEVVHPARAREHGAHLGVGQRSRESQETSRDPDAQDQAGVRQRASDVGRGQEDGGAEDGADRDERAVPRAQRAPELRMFSLTLKL